MILLYNNVKYMPLRAVFSKSTESKNNKLTITLPPEFYKVFSIDEYGYLYNNKGELLFNGYVVNKSLDLKGTESQTTIEFFDKESIMFNKIWSETITDTAPLIIGSVLSKVTNDLEGKLLTNVIIKFVGYPRTDGIQVTVTEHPEIEFTVEDIANNTSAYQAYTSLSASDKFKTITYGAMMKPVYDWVKELSQPDNTGVSKSYFGYLDKDNVYKWYRIDSSGMNAEEELNDNYSLKIAQESQVNFIIAYLGKDLNDAPIYTYAYKDYSGTPNIQSSIKDWADIARDLKSNYTDNTQFRDAVINKGKARAQAYFTNLSSGKVSGKFTLFENKYRLGEILKVKPRFSNESYVVLITSITISYNITKGTQYMFNFEEVID